MRRAVFILLIGLFSQPLFADPISLGTGDRLASDPEVEWYRHPTNPARMIRVPRSQPSSESLRLTDEKLAIFASVTGPSYQGIVEVRLPNGLVRYGFEMQALGSDIVRPSDARTDGERQAMATVMRKLAEKGVVLYNPRFFRVETPGVGVRFIPADPGSSTVHGLTVESARQQTERRISEVFPGHSLPPCLDDLNAYGATAG